MTLGEAIRQTTQRLRDAHIAEAQLDAEFLVAVAAGLPRLHLILNQRSTLGPEQKDRLECLITERLKRKPLAYVLGEQPFMELFLEVNPNVLIPRPETEQLVEVAQRILDGRRNSVIADVGTGSGNIALSLASHPAVAQCYAIDISSKALEVAQRNTLRNRIKSRIRWILGDLLVPLIERGIKADLIVANLPYVRREEISALSLEVRWEPEIALDGGPHGLTCIARLIDQADEVLKPDGMLLLEIGADQQRDVLNLLAGDLWKSVQVFQDLAGHPRLVRAQFDASRVVDPPKIDSKRGTLWIC